ncbi:MAG TPA: type VI secretion system protein TssA [Rhizobacter sp.]|nr:type VI secretion system protein TssA [Rhizobacter sp.]
MNIDELLLPISESAPCGEDLSFSAEFDAIAELRRQDDPTLDQGEWVTTLKVADWPAVQARCSELLAKRSKDLRLAMWLSEAATLNQGYAGLQQGLDLCAQLCTQYWDAIHPQPENGDMEQRSGNIGWFLNRVVSLSIAAPVTRGRTGPYSLQQMQSARSLQTAQVRSGDKTAAPNAEALSLDKFNRALRETPKETLRETVATLQACQLALAAWQAVIDTQMGSEGPSFVPAREALAAALHEAQRLAKEMGATPSAASEGAAMDDGAQAGAAQRPGGGGPLRSREQALAQLREVAAFFRATEPHSPVAYLADKAVHWGDMPLHLWLRSVVKDAGSLAHLEELLGVSRPDSSVEPEAP